MKKIIVTTSWDDGHILDLKLANLLAKYNLAATFYIAPENRQLSPVDRLTEDQVSAIADRFEIGAHTMTHPRLSTIDTITAKTEIENSKSTLERWSRKKITSFCYPEGMYTPEQKHLVHDAGFSLARTTERFSLTTGNDPFELPTTVHAYRHLSDLVPILREAGIANFMRQYLNWDDLAIGLFEKARMNGGVFHLWGHSWEIDKNNNWERLERVFRYISNRNDVEYLTNAQLTI
jgi:peptidoglycan/xylan/chitin deacetylase (PgdA/CDA1 family)